MLITDIRNIISSHGLLSQQKEKKIRGQKEDKFVLVFRDPSLIYNLTKDKQFTMP